MPRPAKILEEPLQLGGWMVFQSETWTISRMQNLKLRQLLHKASLSPPPVWKWVDWWIFQIHKKKQWQYQLKCKDKYPKTNTNSSVKTNTPIHKEKYQLNCKHKYTNTQRQNKPTVKTNTQKHSTVKISTITMTNIFKVKLLSLLPVLWKWFDWWFLYSTSLMFLLRFGLGQ